MSKDMINIDDFVREKLNGHLEKDDPKAWLKMKDLLDKEKPEKVAPFMFRFSKPMAIVGAALLVGALCVGGYKLSALRQLGNNNPTNQTINTAPKNTQYQSPIENKNEENNIDDNEALENNHVSTANTNNKPSNSSTKQDNTKGNKADDRTLEPNNKNQENTAGNTTQQNIAAQNNKEQAKEQKPTAQEKKTTPNQNKESNKNELTTAKTENTNVEKIAAKTETENTPSQEDIINQKTAQRKAAMLKGMSNTLKNKVETKPVVVRQPENNNDGNSQKNENEKTNPNTGTNGNTAANGKQLPKDSMPSVTIVKKSNVSKTFPKKVSQTIDTVAMGKVPVEAIPNSKTSNTTNAKAKNEVLATNVLNAQSPTKTKETNSANTATKKKKVSKPFLGNINFPEAVASAKHDLKNADFYFGFSGGLNYSASKNNGFQGVQFGPTGELVFNKHWSLFGAIKYFNRSGSKKIINDNSSKEYYSGSPDSTIGFTNYFTIHTDSVNRYFNFSTVHSFELPLTIRYTINKFYLMTGMNIAYYLSLNVEQVEKAYNNASTHVVPTNSTKPILSEQKSKLNSTDFGSRMAIGYVIGAGYQITPAWQADIRVVNPFWDNAKGIGSQTISKDFYRIPSIQISVGYQFGRANTRATFGPTQ